MDEFKVVDAAQQTMPDGGVAELIRYEKPNGEHHLHAMPVGSLDEWMVENDYEGTAKQALPLMLNEMLVQMSHGDPEKAPRVVLPKDSAHPVHRMHRNVNRVKVQERRQAARRQRSQQFDAVDPMRERLQEDGWRPDVRGRGERGREEATAAAVLGDNPLLRSGGAGGSADGKAGPGQPAAQRSAGKGTRTEAADQRTAG